MISRLAIAFLGAAVCVNANGGVEEKTNVVKVNDPEVFNHNKRAAVVADPVMAHHGVRVGAEDLTDPAPAKDGVRTTEGFTLADAVQPDGAEFVGEAPQINLEDLDSNSLADMTKVAQVYGEYWFAQVHAEGGHDLNHACQRKLAVDLDLNDLCLKHRHSFRERTRNDVPDLDLNDLCLNGDRSIITTNGKNTIHFSTDEHAIIFTNGSTPVKNLTDLDLNDLCFLSEPSSGASTQDSPDLDLNDICIIFTNGATGGDDADDNGIITTNGNQWCTVMQSEEAQFKVGFSGRTEAAVAQ